MYCSAVSPVGAESAWAAAAEGQAFPTRWSGGAEYGPDILKMQSIRGAEAVTQIVNAPAFNNHVGRLPPTHIRRDMNA